MQTDIDFSPKAAPASVKDTDELRFEQDVLTESLSRPVIVQFWAPWCMPCKQLAPVLEKAVTAAAGAVALVKVNIDKNPGLSQALRVQSVPAVYAFFQGKPVDGFFGAKPESEVAAFVSKLKFAANPPSEAEMTAAEVKKNLAAADDFFRQGKNAEAMELYSAVLDADAENADALGGIGWCLLAEGDAASAREMIVHLPPEIASRGRLPGLNFILSLRDSASGDIAALEGGVQKNPKDLQGHFDLAQNYLAAGQLEKGIDTLVALIRKDREWSDKKARTFLLEVFDALGHNHPLTLSGRKKLSAVLFS